MKVYTYEVFKLPRWVKRLLTMLGLVTPQEIKVIKDAEQ